ncbi:hypothetical protein HG535_0A01680 [Zygotorulaspora mrakii]|uniref:Translation initiation factor eIF2B subunit delta n=1 Tax=Zygotorulaspora mrakii TaxID=42260 RepID=A0A7H9AV86_ZYGMR|nr:uncharacterized protein HG535_0A01680 [Zygotorulaspora mrakii]QLG70230.1 hypothetical protein HG535_0A01680 [Zygotorulaspora mrakii]
MTLGAEAAEGQHDSHATAPKQVDDKKKLSNKELKELKKREKAAKRSAKKQEGGMSIEQQQQQAQMKREKKEVQREQQLQQQRDQQKKREKKAMQSKPSLKKSTLFGHLETAAERRATLLAITSAITTPKASRITASGLMVPTIATAVPGATATTSALSAPNSSTSSTSSTHGGSSPGTLGMGLTATNNSQQEGTNDLAKTFATMTLDSDEFSLVSGISSVIPHAIEQSFDSPQMVSSVKELLMNKNLIHPAVTLLTSQISNYKIVGSTPRCIAMLEAFQIVIKDYQTPPGTTLSRNLTNYLSHQIDILKKARPLNVTMGNAIRWLKQEISLIDPSMADKKAKQELCEKIAQFAREKIELADQLIIGTASHHIENGTTIVAYGSSKVLTDLFIYNSVDLKKNFKVIVVDSRPLFEGKKMAEALRSHGVNVMYGLITGLDDIFNMDVDYVYLGAHSILSNGFLYSRVGTAMVAMTAKRRNIPVLVCCESLKFSQRVQLDSVTFNELADPDDLIYIDSKKSVNLHSASSTLLHQFLKEREEQKKKTIQENKSNTKSNNSSSTSISKPNTISEPSGKTVSNILDGWQDIPSLNIVNVLYDLTPPEYIKKIITEFGALPPSSVPVILREYKSSA